MKSHMPTHRPNHKKKFGLTPFGCYLSINARRQHGLPFSARQLLLWGAVGRGYWRYFLQYHQRASRRHRHPLDNWSQVALQKIIKTAQISGSKKTMLIFPFEHRHHPSKKPIAFQPLAQKLGFTPSPLGMLIHPQFGLWVGFRGAMVGRAIAIRRQKLPRRPASSPALSSSLSSPSSPCAACINKPCIAACPAGAVQKNGFDYAKCNGYLTTHPGCDCLQGGCLARRACPIGTAYQYTKNQSQFFWRGLNN